MDDNTRRKLLLFLFLSPVCFAVAILLLVRPQKTEHDASISQIVKWATLKYEPISAEVGFKDKIDRLRITQTAKLSAVQESLLRQQTYDAVMAYYGDSYEAYRKFRTPIPPKAFNMKQIEYQKKSCKEDWRNPGKDVPDDPEGIHKKFWEVDFLNKYVDPATEVKNSTIGKHLFEGINFENSGITVEEVKKTPGALSDSLMNKYQIGAFTPYPSFVFENTPETILEERGVLTMATVVLQLELPKPEPACPFYCRFYWDESNNSWLPLDIGIAVPGFTRTREFVF